MLCEISSFIALALPTAGIEPGPPAQLQYLLAAILTPLVVRLNNTQKKLNGLCLSQN